LDEAQTIRNPSSQVTRAAHRLKGEFRLALSGTPVENRLEDLWSIFQFLHPGFLGTLGEFQEDWSGPIQRGASARAETLRKRIRPFLLRRLKNEVARELPPRTEIVLEAELSEAEWRHYRAVELSARREVLSALERGESVLGALEVLLRLRQACCHPKLLPGAEAELPASSSKTDLLLESLDTSIAAGHRALVFSQWTSLLDLVEPLLSQRGIAYLRIDGSTTDRGRIVDAFQDPAGPPVLLLSIKAGGTGLTLTAADHVYILDPWWNPAVEDQAADRAHRIGQENPVLIHRLVARDTVEQRILALQEFKRAQAKVVLEGSVPGLPGPSSGLSREELLALLKETQTGP
jgi:SNF2 family DNA or RNA helicase